MWNDLDPLAYLQKGMTIRLFLPADFDRSTAVLKTSNEVNALTFGSPDYLVWKKKHDKTSKNKGLKKKAYRVKKGDTIGKIARKNGVSINDIKRWNGLGKSSRIKPGYRLIIYVGKKKKKSKKKKKRKRGRRK